MTSVRGATPPRAQTPRGRPLLAGWQGWRLLQPLLLSLLNRGRDRRAMGVSLVKFGVFGGGIWWVLWRAASAFVDQFARYPEIAQSLLTTMTGLVLTAAGGLTLIACAIAALSVLFQAPDVRTVLVAPVDWLPRFTGQLLRTAFMGSWAVVLVFTPVLAALARLPEVGVSYWLLALSGGLVGILLCATLGVLLSLGLTALTGAGSATVGLGLVAAIGGTFGWWWLSTGDVGGQLLQAGQGSALAMVSFLEEPTLSWLPSRWLARALVESAWTGRGDVLTLVGMVGVLGWGLLLTGGAYARFYPWLVTRTRHTRRRVGVAQIHVSLFSRIVAWVLPPAEAAIVEKECWRILRSSGDWSHWFLALAGYGIFVGNLDAIDLRGAEPLQRALSQVVALMTLGVGGLILASIATHTVLPSVSLEGPGLPLLRAGPVRAPRLIRAKFGLAVTVFAPLAILLAVVAGWRISAPSSWLLLAACQSTSLAIGLMGLALWFGVRYPLYQARSTGEVASGTGGTLFLMSSVGLTALTLVALAPQAFRLLGQSGDPTVQWADALSPELGKLLGAAAMVVPAALGIVLMLKAERVGWGSGRA